MCGWVGDGGGGGSGSAGMRTRTGIGRGTEIGLDWRKRSRKDRKDGEER